MLTKIQIIGGVGSIERKGKHLKIVSAETQLMVEALAPGGQVLLKTAMRAPMAVELDNDAVRVNLYSDTDQLIEVWYSDLPLDYMQLVSLSASRAEVKSHTFYGGEMQITTKQANRKSIKVKPIGADVYVGASGQMGDGWLIKNGEAETFDTLGDLFMYRPAIDIDLTGVAQAVSEITPTLAVTSVFSYAHFKGKSRVAGASTGWKWSDGSTVKEQINGGIYFVHAGKLYWAFATGSGAQLMESTDGETFTLVGWLPFVSTQMQSINAVWGDIYTLWSQSGYFYQIDVGKREVKRIAAKDAGSQPYVTSPAGVFGLIQNTGADKGLYRLNSDGSWTQVYVSLNTATQMRVVSTNPQTGLLVALIGDKFHTSPDGVAWTKISETTIPGQTYKYAFLGSDAFVGWGGEIKLFKKVPDYLGGGYLEQSADVWADTFSIARPVVDPDDGKVYCIDSASSGGVRSFQSPSFKGSEPIRVQTMELIF